MAWSKRSIFYRCWHWFIALTLVLTATGCTDQKAQAVQTAAAAFSNESTSAVQTLRTLFQNDIAVSFPADQQGSDEIAASLQNLGADKLNSQLFGEVLKGSYITADSLAGDPEFGKLNNEYQQFSAMYDSLRAGRLFASKAVKGSEPLAVRLTVQMVAFAQHVRDNPYQLRARRIVLVNKINRALKLQDAQAKNIALEDLAQQTIQLRNDESDANQAAIRQCLKAAAAGKTVIEAIRNYRQFSAGDVLSLTQESLQFASQIGGSRDVTSLLTQYEGIKDKISNDPYWAPMLNLKVNTLSGDNNGR